MSAAGVAAARPARPIQLAVALSALAGASVALALLGLLGGGSGDRPGAAAPSSYSVPGQGFRVDLPSGWHALGADELAAIASKPVAVLRRDDRRGMVVIRRTAPVKATGAEISRTLERRLRPRFSGFQPVGADLKPIRGGRAFVYTFVRDPASTVQSVALVSLGGRAYAIDTVVPAGAHDAARGAGSIVASFGPGK